jgi:hypothetical protein
MSANSTNPHAAFLDSDSRLRYVYASRATHHFVGSLAHTHVVLNLVSHALM